MGPNPSARSTPGDADRSRRLSKQTGNEQITALRRRQVAALRLRGLTLDEIVTSLREAKFLNPETQQAFGRTTIYNDLRVLETQWLDDAQEFHDKHKARLLAETRELRRAAWQARDHRTVLASLKIEADLFGMFAKDAAPLTGADDDRTVDADNVTRIVDDLSVEQLQALTTVCDALTTPLSDDRPAAD